MLQAPFSAFYLHGLVRACERPHFTDEEAGHRALEPVTETWPPPRSQSGGTRHHPPHTTSRKEKMHATAHIEFPNLSLAHVTRKGGTPNSQATRPGVAMAPAQRWPAELSAVTEMFCNCRPGGQPRVPSAPEELDFHFY